MEILTTYVILFCVAALIFGVGYTVIKLWDMESRIPPADTAEAVGKVLTVSTSTSGAVEVGPKSVEEVLGVTTSDTNKSIRISAAGRLEAFAEMDLPVGTATNQTIRWDAVSKTWVLGPIIQDPGTSGNVLTSDGTDWTSAAAPSGGGSLPNGTEGTVLRWDGGAWSVGPVIPDSVDGQVLTGAGGVWTSAAPTGGTALPDGSDNTVLRWDGAVWAVGPVIPDAGADAQVLTASGGVWTSAAAPGGGGALADGTVTNQVLTWNGSAWGPAETQSANFLSLNEALSSYLYDGSSNVPAAGKWVLVDTSDDSPVTTASAGAFSIRFSDTDADGNKSALATMFAFGFDFSNPGNKIDIWGLEGENFGIVFVVNSTPNASPSGNVASIASVVETGYIEFNSSPTRTDGIQMNIIRSDGSTPPFAFPNGQRFQIRVSNPRKIEEFSGTLANNQYTGSVLVYRPDSAHGDWHISRTYSSPRVILNLDSNATPITCSLNTWSSTIGLSWSEIISNSNFYTVAGGSVQPIQDLELPQKHEIFFSIEIFTDPPGLQCEAAIDISGFVPLTGSVVRITSPSLTSGSETASCRFCVATAISQGQVTTSDVYSIKVRPIEGGATSDIIIPRAVLRVVRIE